MDAARERYCKLNIPELIDIDLHDGGQEIRVESGIRFLKKWLAR